MTTTAAAASRIDAARTGDVFRPMEQVCFVSGTRIAMPGGERPVEDLAEGDLVTVITETGRSYRPVCWIGRRRLVLPGDSRSESLAPVRIQSGAIAQGQPSRDVLVAPDHGIFIDGGLVAARKLVNDVTITQETGPKTVDYYQVELEKHGVLLASGLPVESYLGSRQRVLPVDPAIDATQPLQLWEQAACAPRIVDPIASQELWQRIAARAQRRGLTAIQTETETSLDLHLVADGRVIAPVLSTNDQYSFVLPKGTRQVVLSSRAGRPTHSDGSRPLGVPVVSITLRGRGDMTVLPADALPAGSGWHPPEIGPRTLRRWTDGAGELWFDALPDAKIMDIKLAKPMTSVVPHPASAGLT